MRVTDTFYAASLTVHPRSYVGLPSNDTHGWYYPSHGYASDEDEVDVRFSTAVGNWGRKAARDARWVRHGKMAAWGPSMEEWEVRRLTPYRVLHGLNVKV